MRIFVILVGLCASALFASEGLIAPMPRNSSVVKSVTIQGGTAKVMLATRTGEQLDSAHLRKDVQTLWSTGLFDDIRVQTTEELDGTSVVFNVSAKPSLFLRDLRIEPNSFGIQPILTTGTPIDPLRAQQVALQVQRKLIEHGYVEASADPELVPVGKQKADLLIHVKSGEQVRVRGIEVVGDTVFDPKEVTRAMENLKAKRVLPRIPGIWNGFIVHPAYSEAALQADLARVQSFYLSRGYFDAKVRLDGSQVEGDDAHLRLYVQAGPHYLVNRWEVSGKGVPSKIEAPKGGLFQSQALCSCLIQARRDAEKQGVVDFVTRLNFHPVETPAGGDPIVDLSAEVEEGRPYTIGRIDINGTRHYSEANIRRNLLLDEGDMLDQTRLRKSIARLNQTQMFDQLDETQVAINTDESTGVANIVIPLRERKRGMWSFSGPVGPISFAGPLQFMLASRLPPWGRGILELSTYYVSFSAIGYFSPLAKLVPLMIASKGILPVFSVFRPYTPGEGWRSGFLIAPQLGWQASAYTYATTQIASRLVPIIAGNARYTPQLPVTFERAGGDGVLLCESARPRMHAVRTGLVMALQFIASAPGM